MNDAAIETVEQVFKLLADHCGERGHDEGAVETLMRIIHERDKAQGTLAGVALTELDEKWQNH